MFMSMSRRKLLERSFVGTTGIVLGGRMSSVLAQGTPAASPASPVAGGSTLLAAARDAVGDPSSQYLAIMDNQTFDASHLAEAIQLSWEDIVLGDTSEQAVEEWTAKMRQMIGVKGLSADRPIVVYDEGTLFAALGWWQLAYLGYELPRILDGGLPAWNEAGGTTESGAPEIAPLEVPPVDADVRRALLATRDEVLASLDDPDVLIVDARSSDEYSKGHIPGAVNMLYTSNAIMKDANIYLPPDELRRRYEDAGMAAGKRAITYCSTGVRGSVALFAMRLAGFENVGLYAGSWNEWTSDPETPVEN